MHYCLFTNCKPPQNTPAELDAQSVSVVCDLATFSRQAGEPGRHLPEAVSLWIRQHCHSRAPHSKCDLRLNRNTCFFLPVDTFYYLVTGYHFQRFSATFAEILFPQRTGGILSDLPQMELENTFEVA